MHAINAAGSVGYVIGQCIGTALMLQDNHRNNSALSMPNSTVEPSSPDVLNLSSPFLTTASTGIIGSVLFFLYNSKDSPGYKETEESSLNERSNESSSKERENKGFFRSLSLRERLLLVPLFVWFFLLGAREDIVGFYLIPALTEGELQLDFFTAALVAIVFASALIAGRIMGTLLAKCCHVYAMPIMCEMLGSIFSLCLIFMLNKGDVFIWIYAFAVAMTNGPCLSAALNVTCHVFKADSLILLLCFNCTSLGTFLGVLTCGHVMAHLGSNSFFHVVAFSTVLSFLSLTVIFVLHKSIHRNSGKPDENIP